MATKIEDFKPKSKTGPKQKYPWEIWLNGETWRLVRGEDIKAGSLKIMDRFIRRTASKRNIKVSVYTEPDTDSVVVKAHLPSKKTPKTGSKS